MALKHLLVAAAAAVAVAQQPVQHSCDIIIAGGSLASLAAAITAANASTATVCFMDPTDWPGGQLTASGVPAVDFGPDNAVPANLPGSFNQFLFGYLGSSNPGGCWVSHRCFQPQIAIAEYFLPLLQSLPNLKMFLMTAVTGSTVDAATGRITAVTAVQRTPRPGVEPWDSPLSAQVTDWYSPVDSAEFTKTVHVFNAASASSVVIEATEFGDVLMTAGLTTAQGAEAPLENSTSYTETCGQGTTIPFFMSYAYEQQPTPDPTPGGNGEGEPFSVNPDGWTRVWTYRRSLSIDNSTIDQVVQGEISNQNWGAGNDYDTGYLFLPLAQARAQVAAGKWAGGLNTTALADAEQRAYGWYTYYKNVSNATMQPYLMLNKTQAGTGHGLAKMPYLRDARRSGGGVGGFRLFYADLNANGTIPGTSTRFNDTIGIGQYFYADCHRMNAKTCTLPAYMPVDPAPIKPYYIPFRALTHGDCPNLLVAGKSLAMSFWANAGVRLHPEEWVTGVSAAAAAILMNSHGWSSEQMYTNVALLQDLLSSPAIANPLKWTLPAQ